MKDGNPLNRLHRVEIIIKYHDGINLSHLPVLTPVMTPP